MAVDDAEEELIRCRVEEVQKYVLELQQRLLDYGDVAAARDEVRQKMTASLALIDSMKAKQTDVFKKLITTHKQMALECEDQRQQLATVQKQNECLRNQRDQLCQRVEAQEATARELEAGRSALLDEAERLRRQLADAAALSDRIREQKAAAATELAAQRERLACAQAALADRIAEHATLEAAVAAEQERGECVRASIGELKAEADRGARALRAEIARLRGRCDERTAEAAALRRLADDARDEAADAGGRAAELKRAIKELRDAYYRDKSRADKELADARAEAERVAAELAATSSRLADAQNERARLECELRDRRDAIQRSSAARDKFQRELNGILESADATAEAIRAECEQRDRETATAERKLALLAEEECRLQRLLKDQSGDIRRLRMQEAAQRSAAAAAKSRRGRAPQLQNPRSASAAAECGAGR